MLAFGLPWTLFCKGAAPTGAVAETKIAALMTKRENVRIRISLALPLRSLVTGANTRFRMAFKARGARVAQEQESGT